MRVLHIVNERSSPAVQFVGPLVERGVEVVDAYPDLGDPLPPTLSGYEGVLVGGGIVDTHQVDEYPWLAQEIALLREAIDESVPAFGLCLGAQLLTVAAGGEVVRIQPPEIGWFPVASTDEAPRDRLFAGLPDRYTTCQWHHYSCRPPATTAVLAENDVCSQAFRVGSVAWGTQFHVEVDRAVLLRWWEHGRHVLADHGIDHAAFMGAIDRHLPPYERIGRKLAERFADVVAEGARAAA
jgi:GMP synthase (glutamine-hydrolysing)